MNEAPSNVADEPTFKPVLIPTVGRDVHYVLPNGEHRAAKVTHVQGDGTGIANLVVFKAQKSDHVGINGLINGADPNSPTFLVGGVHPNAEPHPGTYHWPERA